MYTEVATIQPAIYMLTNKRNGTLYIGVTSNLVQRVWQHKHPTVSGFASKYGLKILVWFETTETMCAAIAREKQLKKWNRTWKLELIETMNPDWIDLYDGIC